VNNFPHFGGRTKGEREGEEESGARSGQINSTSLPFFPLFYLLFVFFLHFPNSSHVSVRSFLRPSNEKWRCPCKNICELLAGEKDRKLLN
jgi:hypothetical protein